MPTQNLTLVNDLLARTSFALKFPEHLETLFQADILDARVKNFVKMTIFGLLVYTSFLFTDYLMMPDIIKLIVFVQLLIATPLLIALIFAIHCRHVKPDAGIVLCQLIILATIFLFYALSNSAHADLLIFTIPVSMAFGNVVLPLPFRWSLVFTIISILGSVLAVLLRQGTDITTTAFVILTHSTIGTFMIFSTYRAELSERKTYLFNLRERFRADVLEETNEKLRFLSDTDALTGVYNRRHFDGAFSRLWQAGILAGESLAICIVDIDHFKKLNDTFGHQEGDRCLKAVAQCLQSEMTPNAVLARYGGEEFAILLPGCEALSACACAEGLRSAVSRLTLTSDEGSAMAVTVSIGTCAMIPTASVQRGRLLTEADQALYRAKANGRNRVEASRSRLREDVEGPAQG